MEDVMLEKLRVKVHVFLFVVCELRIKIDAALLVQVSLLSQKLLISFLLAQSEKHLVSFEFTVLQPVLQGITAKLTQV